MSSLSLIQTQKLQQKLSPAQIQVIRMLELPSVELQQRINEELQENPVLEEGADPDTRSLDNSADDDEMGGVNDMEESGSDMDDAQDSNDPYEFSPYEDDDEYVAIQDVNTDNSELSRQDIPSYNTEGLIDHLKSQVYLTRMNKPQRHIAKWILGNIDDDGYLRRTVEQLVDDLSFQEGLVVKDAEMADILSQIKQFDPPGIAAYDLQECLLTQLRQKPSTPSIQWAIRILEKHYESFAKHHFEQIKQRLNLNDDVFKQATDEIIRLNQKPSNALGGGGLEAQYSAVIPDFQVVNVDGKLQTILNTGDIPEIHISTEYKQMLQQVSGRDKEAAKFIRNRIESAKWFIDAINQRNRTLYITMEAIVHHQEAFFLDGDSASLQPMILQDIADKTKLDISTVSRACNNKYVQTEMGIFPLKYFFSESLTNDQGEAISTREIRSFLKQLIDTEDKAAPLNDDRIVEQLREKGYLVARRTIAKYREQMGIPVARLRRQV